MSEPVPESKPANVSELKPASVPEPAEDPWRVAFVEFEKRDTKMVADYREEIDTLLVFAGLFSAVLTAFVVESYQSLQEDYTKTSVDLLRQISSQLANSSFPAAPNPSPFQAQRSDVRVNVCWFVSLLLSLVVALFGIFLKQWMRAYMKWTDVTPDREAVAIRQLRYRSLETWRLAAILALLPTLLQLSVILFLSGLLIFLSNLDRKVAHVKAVLLVITFFLVATVSILPAISRSCRFRSPLSEIIAVTFWRALDYALMSLLVIFVFILSGFRYSPNSDGGLWIQVANWWHVHPKIASWVQADERVVARYNKREDDVTISMHVGAMVRLFCTTQSQQLWSVVLTAIMAECPADNFIHMDPMKQRIYFDQVWWPVLGHVSMRKSDACRLNPDDPRTVTVEFECLSSSMKDCWVSFLLHIKDLVCVARSAGVAEFYMISCLATIESTGGPQCMQAFMDVLGAQYANFNEPHLDSIMYCLEHKYSRTAPLLDWLSDINLPQSMKFICDQLGTMHTITRGHRRILDFLAQFACHVAMATTQEPHKSVPEDLKDLMRALQQADASDTLHQSFGIWECRAPALIAVARREPDLFPTSRKTGIRCMAFPTVERFRKLRMQEGGWEGKGYHRGFS